MELEKIEFTLKYLNTNQQYCQNTGLYTRAIPERRIVTLDYEGDLTDIRKIETASGLLYGYAQEKQLFPVFPAGLLIATDNERITVKVDVLAYPL